MKSIQDFATKTGGVIYKLSAIFLAVIFLFVFEGVGLTINSVKARVSAPKVPDQPPVPQSCTLREVDQLTIIRDSFSQISRLLQASDPLKIQSNATKIKDLLNQISIAMGELSKSNNQCNDDILKNIKALDISGVTKSDDSPLQQKINQILLGYSDIVNSKLAVIKPLQKAADDLDNFAGNLNKLIDLVSAFQAQNQTKAKVMKPIADSIPAPFNAAINLIISALEGIIGQISTEVLIGLVNSLQQVRTQSDQTQATIVKAYTQMLDEVNEEFFGAIDEQKIREAIDAISSFCVNSQNQFSNINGLISASGGAFSGILGKHQGLDFKVKNIPQGIQDDADDTRNRFQNSDQSFSDAQNSLNGIAQSFQNACDLLTKNSQKRLDRIADREGAEDIPAIAQKIQKIQSDIAVDSMTNFKGQIQDQASLALNLADDIEKLTITLDLPSWVYLTNLDNIKRILSELLRADDRISTLIADDELPIADRFEEFIQVADSISDNLGRLAEQADSFIDSATRFVPKNSALNRGGQTGQSEDRATNQGGGENQDSDQQPTEEELQ